MTPNFADKEDEMGREIEESIKKSRTSSISICYAFLSASSADDFQLY